LQLGLRFTLERVVEPLGGRLHERLGVLGLRIEVRIHERVAQHLSTEAEAIVERFDLVVEAAARRRTSLERDVDHALSLAEHRALESRAAAHACEIYNLEGRLGLQHTRDEKRVWRVGRSGRHARDEKGVRLGLGGVRPLSMHRGNLRPLRTL